MKSANCEAFEALGAESNTGAKSRSSDEQERAACQLRPVSACFEDRNRVIICKSHDNLLVVRVR